MIPVSKLVEMFQVMYQEHWSYVWGKAEKGCVDCSGAFDYAFRQYGISYPHGSNAIARKYTVGGMLPLSKAEPGMAAFKARSPGESGYDLPDKYKPGGASYNGDLNDYYHIGLVDDDIRYVLNAKGEKYGFCRDTLSSQGGWDFVSYLRDVDYGKGGDAKVEAAKVVLPSGAKGDTVNLRSAASTKAGILMRVPVGSAVDVIEDSGQWCKIRYDGTTGWMMSNYLEYSGQSDETNTIVLTDEEYEQIQKALQAIDDASSMIGSIIGRG